MVKNDGKRISVYQIVSAGPNGNSSYTPLDIQDVLAKVEARDLNEREWGGVKFVVHRIEDRRYLTIHRPLSQRFLSRIDEVSGKIIDLVGEVDDEGKPLMTSSAISFLRGTNAIAIVKGTLTAPTVQSLIPFLNEFFVAAEGRHWKIIPVIDQPAVEKFSKADGASEFSIRFDAAADLFSEPTDGGIVTFSRELSQSVGSDLVVDVSIKLAGGAYENKKAQRKLLASVKNMAKAKPNASRFTTKVTDEESLESELISLVSQKYFRTIEIDRDATDPGLFTALFEALVEKTPELEKSVKLLL